MLWRRRRHVGPGLTRRETRSNDAVPTTVSIFTRLLSSRAAATAPWVSPVITSFSASLERKVATARKPAITATASAAFCA